ncbi:glucosamine kinase [Pseudaminobacter salicylatoxidans]|uniref:Glucosamine kinase n=1 Tax=Pseudaminobacter salicylatoxidans TaxID=93369 RepID=A0A316BNX6_PSESE|nr:BadF/BadG/BcrA/BcrD ATPase family protein [Pseudaminobacter salicylatoxidans]PWJ75224.1 glucosamine kinase [Pseudaminobacter salicylatoxidans]
MDLVLGIDGGGTSCRAALATASGQVLGRGKSGPANIMTDLEGARHNIVEAARLAFVDAGRDAALIPETGAVLGLAGTNVGGYKQQLLEILPFGRSLVESDALIALNGALGDHDGAIAIIGTGSIFMSRKGTAMQTIGGWGFMLGDLGGGARIGRDLLQETLLAHDDIHPSSPLTQAVMERFGGDAREIVKFGASSKPANFGAFAPLVFEHAVLGDAAAKAVLARAVNDIEEALDALKLSSDQRLCLLGGLSGLVAPHLSARYRALLHAPEQDALGGAVAMAARLFGTAGASAHV